jgi:hypothetical protein
VLLDEFVEVVEDFALALGQWLHAKLREELLRFFALKMQRKQTKGESQMSRSAAAMV